MKLLRDATTYAGFLAGLPAFLRRRIDPAEARDRIIRRLEDREERFIALADRAIFRSPPSPYRRLLELAGCEQGDLEALIRDRGLEGGLASLREGGVYVTFEEFKGRQPLVRDGVEIPLSADSFDNPGLGRYVRQATGGSSGAVRHVSMDLDFMLESAFELTVIDALHGFHDRPTAIWFDGLPGPGLGLALKRVLTGHPIERWFSPVHDRGNRSPARFRWAERGVLWTAGLCRAPVPFPEPVPLDRPDIVARWLGETLARHGRAGLRTMVSRALRVALAAEEAGIDLTGTLITTGGEPPTEAKVAVIQRSGATFQSGYHFSEAGAIALACTKPATFDELHLMAHRVELLQHPRTLEGGHVVHPFYFTTLLDSAPKILLNTEIDDYGEVFERPCGCPMEELGLTRHLRAIRSFSKLTGEGVTLVGSDMVRVLEEVLPRRFGGSPLDYQLHEEEDDEGFTRLSVVVSPRIRLDSEDQVVDAVATALERGGADAIISERMWRQAGTLRVKRAEPVWTGRGKLLPLHLVERPNGRPSGDGSPALPGRTDRSGDAR